MPVIGSLGSASAGGFGATAPYHQPGILFSGGGLGLRAYKWDEVNGIGEQFPAPPSYTGTAARPVQIIGNSQNPRINTIVSAPSIGGLGFNAYEWNGQRGGFVKKYGEPSSYLSGATTTQETWNNDRTRVVHQITATPYFAMWAWSEAGHGARLTTTGSLGVAAPQSDQMMINSPNGEWFVQEGSSSPGIIQPYKWADALNLSLRNGWPYQPAASGYDIRSFFWPPTPTNNPAYLLYTGSNPGSPLSGSMWGACTWNNSTGLTALTAGRVTPNVNINGSMTGSFNPSGTHIVTAGGRSITGRIGYINVIIWNGAPNNCTLMAEPPSGTTLAGGAIQGCNPSWNSKETYVVVTAAVAPWYSIYRWSNATGLGVRLSVPDLGAISAVTAKFI